MSLHIHGSLVRAAPVTPCPAATTPGGTLSFPKPLALALVAMLAAACGQKGPLTPAQGGAPQSRGATVASPASAAASAAAPAGSR